MDRSKPLVWSRPWSAAAEGRFLDMIGDAVIASDAEFRITLWNRGAEVLYGWTAEEAIGQVGIELLRSEYTGNRRDELLSSLQESGEWRGEDTHYRMDGSPIVVQATSSILRDSNGEVVGYLSVNRDISQQKRFEEALRESEARYRSLFTNMLDGFAYCRMIFEEGEPRDFVYLDVNRRFDELTGLRDVLGKRVTEIIPGIRESNPELFEIYGRVALTGAPESFETYLPDLGWLSISVYSPQREYFVAVFENITEGRLAEDALRQSLDDLRRSDEQRRQLLSRLVAAQEEERARIAADIHDDSIQVMTAVGMRLETLLRAGSEEVRTEAIGKLKEMVSASITRLRRLLFELRPRILDEEGLAPALHELLEHMEEETEIQTHLDDRLGEEPGVETRVILYRIAQEALTNVRKHARAGSVTVTLVRKDGGVLLRIRDDGVGLDPGAVESAGPMHLGLSTMRERAEIAGGWRWIDPSPGPGTRVEFWIPEESLQRIAPGDS